MDQEIQIPVENKTKPKQVPKLRFNEFLEEWIEIRLGKVCSTFKSGTNITSENIFEKGIYPVYGGNGLRGYTDTFTHEGFYFLIGRQGALCGNINKVDGKSFISEHAIAVKANKSSDTEWLAQKLDFFKLNRLSESSAQPGLAVGKLVKLKLNIPSLPEQQKIATFLSAVDKKIQQLTRKKELLERYKKGVMQQLFSQKLRFKDKNGNDFPEWELKRLGDVSTFLDGRRKPIKSSERSKMKGEYPYYGASGIIDYVNNYIFDEEIILLGEDGENIISRNLPLAFRVSGKCWINNHAHVIKPNSKTDIDFLTFSLERINYVPYNTGTAQPKLNQEVCRNISIILPSYLEQQKIARFLSETDNKIEAVSQQITKTQSFKKGLLQQMFV